MENESQVFTRVENNPALHPHRPRKLHHMDTEETTEDTDDEDRNGRITRKPKKQLRRRSSLHAELEGSDAFEDLNPSESPFFLKSHNGASNGHLYPDPHTNVHSSMSMLSMSTTTNNAITVAPSRNNKTELNVFDTRHHHRRHHHGHRRRRSTTPDPHTNHHHNNHHRSKQAPPLNKEEGLQSLLERLDNRIKNNFGDWSSVDDDTNFEYRSVGRVPNGTQKGPMGGQKGPVGGQKNGSVSLPPLYKNYHAVLKSAKGKLMDRTCIALSKDNNDAKSVLSEAKRTLTQMGVPETSSSSY